MALSSSTGGMFARSHFVNRPLSTQLSVPVALRRESAVGFVGNEPNGVAQARSYEANSRWAGVGSVGHTHGSRLPDVQLLELPGVDGARGAGHEVGALGGLGEGDAVADVGQPGVEHDQPVEPQRDAAVRRRAVAQGAEQEAELLLGLSGVRPSSAKILDWITGSWQRIVPPPPPRR